MGCVWFEISDWDLFVPVHEGSHTALMAESNLGSLSFARMLQLNFHGGKEKKKSLIFSLSSQPYSGGIGSSGEAPSPISLRSIWPPIISNIFFLKKKRSWYGTGQMVYNPYVAIISDTPHSLRQFFLCTSISCLHFLAGFFLFLNFWVCLYLLNSLLQFTWTNPPIFGTRFLLENIAMIPFLFPEFHLGGSYFSKIYLL